MAESGLSQGVDQLMRVLSKGLFAGADVFLGEWPGPRILIYHQLTERPHFEMDVSPEVFKSHLRWLTDHGRILGLEEALVGPEDANAKERFVLTFDDGYLGLYQHGYPVLLERGLPFTLYLTSGFLDGTATEDKETLNWDQVNRMQESGLVTIAAHTHTHPDFRQISSTEIESEIGTSNELIERHTGVRPRHFAYTKGYWASPAESLVKRHYQTAVLGAGPPITADTDLYRLGRIPVQKSDGVFFFKRKIQKGMRLEERVRSRLKGYENPGGSTPHKTAPAP